MVLIGFLYKTAQKPLKSCLKNRSKITARNERFLSFERFFKQDLSGLSVFPEKNAQTAQTAQTTQTAQTAQTSQVLLENRSNRSYLERFLSGISTRAQSKNDFRHRPGHSHMRICFLLAKSHCGAKDNQNIANWKFRWFAKRHSQFSKNRTGRRMHYLQEERRSKKINGMRQLEADKLMRSSFSVLGLQKENKFSPTDQFWNTKRNLQITFLYKINPSIPSTDK